MSSKKVVSASSLMRLCNGCCSRNVGNCIKSHNMLRTMCTAVERWDFQFSGGYQAVDSYQQNQAGFHQQNAGGYQAVDSYQQNQAGFHQQNAGGSYQNNHASSEQISYGSGHSASGRHINIPQNVAQNNLAGHNGSVSADFGQSNLKVHHKVGVGVDDSRGVGTHPNAFYEKHNWRLDSGEKVKYPNAYSLPRPLEYQGQKGNLTQNTGRFQQAPNDYYTRSNETGQQYSAYRQSQQCLVDGPYTPNLNTTQKPMVSSPLSSSAKPDGVSFEASNDGPYRGTLEELDSFYVEGKVKEAVEVLQVLEKLHVPVGLDRCVQLMHQCGKTKSLEEAKVVHRHALQHFSPLKVSTCNIILEMYFECGSEDDALKVFKNMPERDLTTWCTMIKQLTKNGFAEDSIDLFTEFKSLGLKPDGQIFIAVFSACSMLGDIDEGMLHFESMSKDYGIVPSMAHYVSVVDMIGGIGHLDEALEFIEKMPLEPSADVWETLMNMCRVHGNTELGDRCTELIEKLDPTRLNEKSKTGLLLEENPDSTKNKEQNKLASKNLLEVRSRIHEYRAGDTSHPENDKIYALLRGLRVQMKEAGYIPETKFVLHDIDLESKEDALLAHSERLAVAYGLLNSSARSPIRVIKNLRVCGDCHTALKIISELVGRELIIRDAKRFHHFKNGLCSCRDYW
ncbi:pentatricopeptide repeat-containing protein At2g34370, mitochondrial-like isoform X2 [Cicer arietinum]|uniref:Pentatricopeptide repeat-containing protein At4g32450, mitochondrial-like isoform X2 n=1 Tax=Cicer arietinum TaxID=3827 RepID=A0A1S3DWR7_CICAR|nr:pentatricopeptide repeat-containing protein At4g32450, mitochondrial-like isoform X2 [Cicer arietinum]XP_012567923.1 pentatricopeptide repeat-containing protein At4g32450, mitochondrial-like isoform X3 [Cicer arietinum]